MSEFQNIPQMHSTAHELIAAWVLVSVAFGVLLVL